MIKCLKTCEELDVSCPVKECRYWINYETVRVNHAMTLREVADRLNISYVRVKQIQDKTFKKIGPLLK